jgi:hypothetical protein
MATDIRAQILEHIQCSHAALDSANAELTKAASDKQAAEALIPEAVKALLEVKYIKPEQEKRASDMLKDPAQAIKILTNVLKTAMEREKAPPSLGQPGAEKKASAPSNQFYGGQRTSEPRESDLAFRRALGV